MAQVPLTILFSYFLAYFRATGLMTHDGMFASVRGVLALPTLSLFGKSLPIFYFYFFLKRGVV